MHLTRRDSSSSVVISRGSLLTRSLADIVKKEHFVLSSEYLVTLLVVVPKWVLLLLLLFDFNPIYLILSTK